MNGRRIDEPELLSVGDRIEVGGTTLVVQVSVSPPATAVGEPEMAAAASEPGPPDDEPAEREPEPEPPDEEPAEPEPAPPDEEPAEPGPAPVAQAEPPSAEPEPVLPPLSLRVDFDAASARCAWRSVPWRSPCGLFSRAVAGGSRRAPATSSVVRTMGKIAFLFPGQGSQKVGMGGALLDSRPELYEPLLELAEAASGLPIRQHGLEGPQETLTRTDVAQPALFALSLAVNAAAREAGLQPDYVGGHSLGEYTAAVAAGAMSEEEGMSVVSLRGRLMAEVQDVRPGAMAAVIGLERDAVDSLCKEASERGLVSPANINSPTQIVCSGEEGPSTASSSWPARPARKGRFGCRSGRPFTAS